VLAENRFSITERFMDERHRAMWQVVEQPEQVVGALANATPWFPSARSFAAQLAAHRHRPVGLPTTAAC
jgi:hypothetical protein